MTEFASDTTNINDLTPDEIAKGFGGCDKDGMLMTSANVNGALNWITSQVGSDTFAKKFEIKDIEGEKHLVITLNDSASTTLKVKISEFGFSGGGTTGVTDKFTIDGHTVVIKDGIITSVTKLDTFKKTRDTYTANQGSTTWSGPPICTNDDPFVGHTLDTEFISPGTGKKFSVICPDYVTSQSQVRVSGAKRYSGGGSQKVTYETLANGKIKATMRFATAEPYAEVKLYFRES